MAKERKRNVQGFPNYRVSEKGYVQNKKTGRILKASPDRRGYMTVGLSKDGKHHTRRVHKLVGKAFLKQPSKEAWQLDHINGDKRDCSVSNLEYVTPGENMRRAYANGLNHWEGYNERPVRIVETGEVFKSQAECARAIGGNQPNINACLAGRRHKHMGYRYEYAD